MSPDPVTGRLEFTVKAKKQLRRGWKLAIYSVYGRWNDLGATSTRIGDIFFEDKDFYKNYDGPVNSYECFVDSSYKSTYWEEAEGEKVKIGTEICTIVARGLPVKDEGRTAEKRAGLNHIGLAIYIYLLLVVVIIESVLADLLSNWLHYVLY
jgi:hypothetical protein